MPEVEKGIDWVAFRSAAIRLLEAGGAKYYIKNDLRAAC
jgi:hypothetical protein